MSVANLVIFLIAVAGLALLVAQNLSPSVSLVFLGTQSPALPLSFWIVIAISVGVILSLLIWGLFQLSGPGTAVARSSPSRSPKPPVRPTTGFTPEPTPEPTSAYSAGQTPPHTTPNSTGYSPPPPRSTTSTTDDWETEVRPIRQSWDEEDWGLDDEEESVHSTPSQTAWKGPEGSSDFDNGEPMSEASEERSSNDADSEYSYRDHYEVEQKPKQQSWSGSVYSYGYREGEDTGVGKSESVYDADYRIITPPPPATEIQDQEEEEDWELQESEADPEDSSSRSTDEQSQTNDDRRSTEY